MKNRQVARILYEIAELLGLEEVQFKPLPTDGRRRQSNPVASQLRNWRPRVV